MTAREWRDACLARDRNRCQARKHHGHCDRFFRTLEVHHIVYKSHLSKRSMWLVENGITLSLMCHALAHGTHNANLPPKRLREAVAAVNAVDKVPVPPFKEGEL